MSLKDTIKDPKFWLEVIIFVLTLIKGGMEKDKAVSMAAEKFNVNRSDILMRLKK